MVGEYRHMTDATPSTTTPDSQWTPHEKLLDDILEIALEKAFWDQLALLQEGFLHVEIIRGLLVKGYDLFAGKNWRLRHAPQEAEIQGKPRKYAIPEQISGATLPDDSPTNTNPDIRIEKPRFCVELKVYSEFGPKSSIPRSKPGDGNHTIADDIRKVVKGTADAAVSIMPGHLYSVARGLKETAPVAAILLDDLFPPAALVGRGDLKTFRQEFEQQKLLVRLWAAPSPTKDPENSEDISVRVAIAVLNCDPERWPNFMGTSTSAQEQIQRATPFLQLIYENWTW